MDIISSNSSGSSNNLKSGSGADNNGIGDSLLAVFSRDGSDLINSLDKYHDPQFFELDKIASDLRNYYLIILAVIGVPSNALTVATILSMHALSPATFFVVLLAIFDGCALLVKLIGNQLDQHGVSGSVALCKTLDPLSIFFSTTANWILVLICLERFISVCYPLKKVYLFTKRRSFIIAAVLIGVLFTLIMTTLGVTRTLAASTGKCTTEKRFNYFYNNVWLYLNVALHLFIPFIFIAFLTSFIIYGLRQSRKHRMSLMRKSDSGGAETKTGGKQGGNSAPIKSRSPSTPITPTALHNQKMLDDTARVERSITLMLIAAGIIFLVLSLPISVYYLIRGFKVHQKRTAEHARWTLFQQIAFLFIDSSHAVNFFLYFFTAKRFRVQLIRILTRRAGANGSRQGNRSNSRPDNVPSSKSTSSNATASTSLTSKCNVGSIINLPPASV